MNNIITLVVVCFELRNLSVTGMLLKVVGVRTELI